MNLLKKQMEDMKKMILDQANEFEEKKKEIADL